MQKLWSFSCLALFTLGASFAVAAPPSPPLGDYEAHLKEAQSISTEIVAREAQVAEQQKQLLSSLDAAVKNYDPKRLGTLDAVVQNLRPAVHHMHTASQQLLDNQAAYVANLRALHEAVTKASEIYRTASKVFDQYADEETFVEIKQDYHTLAETWRLMADSMEHRDVSVVEEGKEIVAFRSHLEHTSLFLERLDQHLASVPEMPSAEERASHVEQIRRYIEGFESLRQSLRAFHMKLQPTVSVPQTATNDNDVQLIARDSAYSSDSPGVSGFRPRYPRRDVSR
jgi:DNA repair exonuclease SbcCD ATPase subunit